MAKLDDVMVINMTDVIAAIRELEELRRSIGAMFLFLREYEKGRHHDSLTTSDPTARIVMKYIRQLTEENKALKEQLTANSTTANP